MAGYLPMKMKRKDLEEVYDEFSDFSLSSPARKIRRLDAELPPIMEEEEAPEIAMGFEQIVSEQPDITRQQLGAVTTEAVPSVPLNEERALVLYNPANTPMLKTPSSPGFSITVNSDLIPGLKDHIFWSNHTKSVKTTEDEAASADKNKSVTNDSLAVVPWVPYQHPTFSGTEVPAPGLSEMMEAEGDATMMEIEDEDGGQAWGTDAIVGGGESLQQWQQQHCMTPEFPQNTSTPVMW
ncbi:PREDICTED: uncharacterized protein LOC104601606 [Nelumbo nucifera]|uniref:Uncharacterized protein LOC104601606 n=1 Tax=Nelumbo nucifera TaxID=4432 RepID=A0A1U8A9E1_NELNU|nr:PREDICTED: uncharacterized protein LOC104601606 [Nelumbo nucifera]